MLNPHNYKKLLCTQKNLTNVCEVNISHAARDFLLIHATIKSVWKTQYNHRMNFILVKKIISWHHISSKEAACSPHQQIWKYKKKFKFFFSHSISVLFKYRGVSDE